ncbi:MAG TPA: lipoyl(octanoyl) transferase LipB [Terriglobales bacterium]|nr:lipoyl(octanoyl) transferase LipB [Terriglobales bacterium]
MAQNLISVVQLGTLDYATGLRLQQSLVEMRKAGQVGDVLLLLEHSPVITLGRNARRENLLASPELLARKGVEVFECDRGGDITFHGPGQLVGYPIFDLRGFQPRIGAVEFVRRLEQALIRSCADFGVACGRVKGLTGVWTTPSTPVILSEDAAHQPASESKDLASFDDKHQAKIAAIGVHISRGVTSHGFALNVNTDLEYFQFIVPCGITGKLVTSLEHETGAQMNLDDVARSAAGHFAQVFASDVQWVDTLDALLGRTVGVPMQPPAELRKLRGDDEIFRA